MHEKWEPPAKRPPFDVRVKRLEKRISGWLAMSNWRWRKVVLASDPSKIIGHSGWQIPQKGQNGRPFMNVWARSAVEALGVQDAMGWSDEEVADMWAGVDIEYWDKEFRHFDDVRAKVVGEEPHWFLAPLWVLPEFQGRGVASMLLKEVIEEADQHSPSTPMYLEASPQGRPIYEHFGFVGFEEKEREHSLIRRGPPQR